MYLPTDRLGWFCTKSVLLGTILLWRSLRFLTPLLLCSLEMLAWLTCWWDQIVSASAGAGASSPVPLLSACLVDWFCSLPAESFRLVALMSLLCCAYAWSMKWYIWNFLHILVVGPSSCWSILVHWFCSESLFVACNTTIDLTRFCSLLSKVQTTWTCATVLVRKSSVFTMIC